MPQVEGALAPKIDDKSICLGGTHRHFPRIVTLMERGEEEEDALSKVLTKG